MEARVRRQKCKLCRPSEVLPSLFAGLVRCSLRIAQTLPSLLALFLVWQWLLYRRESNDGEAMLLRVPLHEHGHDVACILKKGFPVPAPKNINAQHTLR